MGKKGDLSDFECGMVVGSRVYREWSEKEKISSERQLCGRKCLVDVRGQRRMGRLVRDFRKATVMALFHCMVRFGTARYGTVRLSSGRFAFPLQFSTAIEWAGLFTRRYNCAASTAVTSS